MYQLDKGDCNKDVDSLSPLVDLFVSENDIRVFKVFTPLSRDEIKTVWNRIGVQVITAWISDRGPRCKTTPKDIFLLNCLFPIHLQDWKNHDVTFGMTSHTAYKTC